MKKEKILIVLTSHSQLGDSGKSTGFHYEELTTPYRIFAEAGYDVTLASIKGGKPPHDPGSLKDELEENPDSVVEFLRDEAAKNKLRETAAVSSLSANDFCALYLPGGHGTMWDLPHSEELGELVSDFYKAGKPVAAVCHGIAGLLGAKRADGTPLVKGQLVNSFTNEEEKAVELQDTVPFMLETALKDSGAKFECADKFKSHVAEDKNLITGQNPASAAGVGDAVVAYLKDHKVNAA